MAQLINDTLQTLEDARMETAQLEDRDSQAGVSRLQVSNKYYNKGPFLCALVGIVELDIIYVYIF